MAKLLQAAQQASTDTLYVNFTTSDGKRLAFQSLSSKGDNQAYRKALQDRAEEMFKQDPDLEKIEFPVNAVIYRRKADESVDLPF